MVPNGWTEVKLGEVITHQKGFAFKSENYCHDGKRIIRISDTDRNSIHDRSPVYVSDENSVGLERYSLSEGDIILSTVGSRPHLLDSMVGKAVQIPAKDDGALLNQNLVKLSPKKKVITNNYLFSMLKKNKFNFFISTLVRGNANQVSITLNELFSYSFLLPTYEEQRKIAKILSTWDKTISTTEALIETSKQQKKALMQQLLTGKKRLVDPETGEKFEGEWDEVKLGDLGKTFTGLTGKTKEHFGRGSKYIPYINIFRNSSVDMNALELVDVRPNEKQNLVKYGDIFFTTSSETPEDVGMSSVILEEIDESVYLNSFCFGFRPHNFNRVKPEFIRYLLRSEKVRRSISLLAQGATRYNLSKTQLLKITLNIPSLGEQQKIASVLTAADKEIEIFESKLAHLKKEKKALMQQLLTGKRRVKVKEEEAA